MIPPVPFARVGGESGQWEGGGEEKQELSKPPVHLAAESGRFECTVTLQVLLVGRMSLLSRHTQRYIIAKIRYQG
jgi:hypothetical protein